MQDILAFIRTCKWTTCGTEIAAGTTWLEQVLFCIAMVGHMAALMASLGYSPDDPKPQRDDLAWANVTMIHVHT